MTLHHLEVFVAVCQKKTMHAAAEKLNLSQPSISKIIADLENIITSSYLSESITGCI